MSKTDSPRQRALACRDQLVPRLVIHLVKDLEEPSEQSELQTMNQFMGFFEEEKAQHSAILNDRKIISQDIIVVSPKIFIEHAPWRCQRAIKNLRIIPVK